jgi:transcriptional antiterminator RfaH
MPDAASSNLGATMRNDNAHYDSAAEPSETLHEARNARWYVVQTHQNCEGQAERHLSSQEFRTYLPKRRRTVRHARSIRTVSGAYFDCYLFVSLDIRNQRWSPINSTVGVRKLVTSDRSPIPVPYGVVESLILATDEEGFLHPSSLLVPGQTIRVADGPFADQLGTLDYVGRTGAVRVLLDIMNRSVPIYINRDKCLIIR